MTTQQTIEILEGSLTAIDRHTSMCSAILWAIWDRHPSLLPSEITMQRNDITVEVWKDRIDGCIPLYTTMRYWYPKNDTKSRIANITATIDRLKKELRSTEAN